MPRPKRKPHVLARYERNNPKRLPRWRYDRIRKLLDQNERLPRERHKKPNHMRDEDCLFEAFQFLRDWEEFNKKDTDPEELEDLRCEALFEQNEGLYYAYQIFNGGDDDDVRYKLEAQILTRRSDEAIAERVGVIPEAVDWYEKVFFHVRDRLDHRDWVQSRVIGQVINKGLENLTMSLSAKYFAYFGGPRVLDFVLDGVDRGLKPPTRADDMGDYVNKLVAQGVGRRSMESVNVFEVNKFNVMQLFEIHSRFIEMVERRQQEQGVKTPLEEVVSSMLGVIPWSVGMARDKVLTRSPLKPYLGHQAEPRASDLMLINSGDAPYNAEEIAAKRLPPPPVKEDKNEDAK